MSKLPPGFKSIDVPDAKVNVVPAERLNEPIVCPHVSTPPILKVPLAVMDGVALEDIDASQY